MTTINIIGCGKLGKTIAKLLVNKRAGNIMGVVNSNIANANAAIHHIGQGEAFSSLNELPTADVYLITTQDDIIEKIARDLIATNKIKKESIILHCSGSLSSHILYPAKAAGCYIASVHPIKSFANPDDAVKTFDGTICAFEGDAEALSVIKPLFESIGGRLITLNSHNKMQYHAATVMANNYLVTLHYHATQQLISAGVEVETAKTIISNLMTDAFNNLKELDHAKALTGPIQRGDAETIKGHMNAISDPVSRRIYAALGIGTLPLTNHSSDKVEEIKKSFNSLNNTD